MSWSPVGTPTSQTSYSTTALSITLPTGYSTGDLLLVMGGARTNTHYFDGTVPTGWTMLASASGTFTTSNWGIFGKIAESAAETAPQFTISEGSSKVYTSCAFRDSNGVMDLASILDGTPTTSLTTGNAFITYPSLTVTANDCLVLLYAHAAKYSLGGAEDSSIDAVSGFTDIIEAEHQVNFGSIIEPKYQIQTTATSITGSTIGLTNFTAEANNGLYGAVLALKSSSAATGTGSLLFNVAGSGLLKSSPGSTDFTYASACMWAKIPATAVAGGTYTGPFYIYNGTQYRVAGFSGTGIANGGAFGGGGTAACADDFSPALTADTWYGWAVRLNGSGAGAFSVRIYDSNMNLVDEASGDTDAAYSAGTTTSMYLIGNASKSTQGRFGRMRCWAGASAGACLSWADLERELRSTTLVTSGSNILDALGDSTASPSGWTFYNATVDTGDTPPVFPNPAYSLRTANPWLSSGSTTTVVDIGTENTDWFPGDLALILATPRNQSHNPNTPAGWTLLASNTEVATCLFGRILQTGDTDPTFTWDGTSAKKLQCAIFSGDVYSDLSTIVAHSSARTTGGALQMPYQGLTVTTDNCLVLVCSGKTKSSISDTTTVADEAGFTTIGKYVGGGDFSNIGAWCFVQQAAATDITAGSWDLTSNPGVDEADTVVGFTVALRTAAVAGPAYMLLSRTIS